MIEGTTKSGFKFKIDERCLSDYSILRIIDEYDSSDDMGKMRLIPGLVNFMLGKGGFEKLEKHIRSKNEGFCSITDLQTEILEVMQNTKEIKN